MPQGWITLAVEDPRRAPDVHADVDEIQHDCHLHAVVACYHPQVSELVATAIDLRAPAFGAFGITAHSLIKRLADDGLRRVLDARPHTLAFRAWVLGRSRPLFRPQLRENPFRRADEGLRWYRQQRRCPYV